MERTQKVGVDKPHIMLKPGSNIWLCVTSPGQLGWGHTPAEAHEAWESGVRLQNLPAWQHHHGSEVRQ